MTENILLYIKLFVGTTLSFFLIFFIWKSSYSEYCFSLLLIFIMVLVVSYGYIELKMKERACIKKCYFKSDTLMARILSSRFFVSIFYVVASVVMSVSTFMVSLDFSKELWLYFIVHILLAIFVFKSMNHIFSSVLQDDQISLFAREWSIRIMSVVLIGVFVYLSLNEYTPEYLTHSLKETIGNAVATVSSECRYIEILLQYGKSIDASFWWIINESTEQVHNTVVKTGIWMTFLFYNSLAILGINRFIFQIIYILNKIFDHVKEA